MFGLSWAQLLFSTINFAVSALPDVEQALTQHWGKDHVVQAQLGLQTLTNLVNKVGASFDAAAAQSKPSTAMGIAPTSQSTAYSTMASGNISNKSLGS